MTQFAILIILLILIPFALNEHNYQTKKESRINLNILNANQLLYRRNKLISEGYNSEGVYIFTNLSNNNYKYVGQSVDMLNRVNTHLKGKGNKDIYNDIKKGNDFTIEFIKLKDSTFSSLDNLEKYLISANNSYYNGYNKTRGNG